MNQINLDKLAGTTSLRPDNGAIRLMLAEVYQGQVQLLSGGNKQLQLQTPQGSLQLALPATVPAIFTGQVQVRPHLLPDGQLQLQLQTQSAMPAKINLTATQASTLFSQLNGSSVITNIQQNIIQVPVILQQRGNNWSIQLPQQPPLSLSKETANTISQLQQQYPQATLQAQLQFRTGQPPVLHLTVTAVSQPPVPVNLPLRQAEQQQLLQQLNRILPAVTVEQGRFTLSGQQFSMHPLHAAQHGVYQPQLQQHQQQWQLSLQSAPQTTQIIPRQQDFSRPVQLVPAGIQAPPILHRPVPQHLEQSVSQAWRNLLPLLVPPSRLAELPELPPAANQLLTWVRQSQPDISKTPAPAQLAQQLNSLLQFQPLQPAPASATTGGAMAVVIQLLLGHLLGRQAPPASQAAALNHSQQAQLVSQLDQQNAGQLLRQLATQSGQLQHAQLATLDNTSQLQQWLLQLPLHQQGQSIFSQLHIEQREAEGKQAGEKTRQWQLTMKFDLQQHGQLLAVVKLQQQDMQLQLYTENQHTQFLAEKFMPVLKDRFKMQGVQLTQTSCQLGKIPDTLLPRANSLVTVRV